MPDVLDGVKILKLKEKQYSSCQLTNILLNFQHTVFVLLRLCQKRCKHPKIPHGINNILKALIKLSPYVNHRFTERHSGFKLDRR